MLSITNDSDSKELYFVQAKWISSGNGSPSQGDILKFINGLKRLLQLDFSNASDKLKRKLSIVEHALMDSNYRLKLVIAYTGTQRLSTDAQRDVDTFVNEMNDTSDVIESIVINQKDLYNIISGGADATPINIDDIDLRDWGKLESPYLTYYGHINAAVIASWWNQYGNRLFAKNIRYYKGSTETNEGIVKTLTERPKDFWYFNNGIKILCDSFSKKPIYGDDRSVGLFTAHGVSIVNGAQTVGCIGAASRNEEAQLNDAQVFVQFISLDNTPEGYDVQVTKLSNTQNKIDGKDFAALDPQQDRLRRDLWMDGITYLYKGIMLPQTEKEISMEEATIALACFNRDVRFSTLAKRNIGAFYESINKSPYTDIFNDQTNAVLLYNAVLELRYVEQLLTERRAVAERKLKQILVHGNRFILHGVFQHQTLRHQLSHHKEYEEIKTDVNNCLDSIITYTEEGIREYFPDNYINSLFKNNIKCTSLERYLTERLS